jgi:hypothetical protein
MTAAPRAYRVAGANGSDAGAVPGGCGGVCETGDVARPHCQNRRACRAKTPGKHCQPCSAGSPEVRERKRLSQIARLQDPVKRATAIQVLDRQRSDPEIEARRIAGVRGAHARPEVKQRHRQGCRDAKARMMADPAYREMLSEFGRELGAKNLRAAQSPEVRQRAAKKIRAVHLAWCPPRFWDLNAQMKRKAVPLDERKRIIAEEIAREDPKAEARRIIDRITREMHDKRAREQREAY